MLSNCGAGEDAWDSLELEDQSSQSLRKSTLNIHWKDHAEAEAPILWPPDAKSWLTRKDPDDGKDWRQEKGTTEDKMVDGITNLTDMSLSKLWELVMEREAWRAAVHEVTKSWTWLSDWTELDGPWGHHGKWNVRQKKTNTTWYLLYVESKNKTHRNRDQICDHKQQVRGIGIGRMYQMIQTSS